MGTRGLCPGWGTWQSLSRLQVQPVAKLSMDQRDTQAQRTLTRLVTHTATGKVLPSTVPACRTPVKHIHGQPSPFLLRGWQRQEVTSAGTHDTLQVHSHMHIRSSSSTASSPACHPNQILGPLTSPWVPDSLAGPAWCSLAKHTALTRLSLMVPTFTGYPGCTSMGPPT